VVERRLHLLQGRLHPTQGPSVAMAQRVQGPLQRDASQLGGLAQLLTGSNK
jgi:hypothetical protein